MELKRILFCVPAHHLHLHPSLSIARHLVQRGHTVAFCSGSMAGDMAVNCGIHTFYPRDTYQQMFDIIAASGYANKWYTIARLFNQKVLLKCMHELIKAFEDFKPDAVYIDTTDLMAVVVAERYNVPYAHGSATAIFYYEKDIPPYGTGWHPKTKWLNRLRTPFFLAQQLPFILKCYLTQKMAMKTIDPGWNKINISGVSPYLYMLFSTDRLEYQRHDFLAPVFYVGPAILEPHESRCKIFPLRRIDQFIPIIYVSMGTVVGNSPVYRKAFRAIISVLSDVRFPRKVQVVIAAGNNTTGMGPGEIPANCTMVDYTLQEQMLRRAGLVICPGEEYTVYHALKFGKPLLVLHLGHDKVDMAERVAYSGAGIRLHAGRAVPDRIKTAILDLLGQDSYACAAAKLQESFNSCQGDMTGAALLERLAMTGRPIRRRRDAPITISSIDQLPSMLETMDAAKESRQPVSV